MSLVGRPTISLSNHSTPSPNTASSGGSPDTAGNFNSKPIKDQKDPHLRRSDDLHIYAAPSYDLLTTTSLSYLYSRWQNIPPSDSISRPKPDSGGHGRRLDLSEYPMTIVVPFHPRRRREDVVARQQSHSMGQKKVNKPAHCALSTFWSSFQLFP